MLSRVAIFRRLFIRRQQAATSVAVGCFVYPTFLQAFSGCTDILLMTSTRCGWDRLSALLLCFWWRWEFPHRRGSEKSQVFPPPH
ncbi:hypothetical protein V8E53_011599 [Lactarius tabidus]